MRYGLSYRRWQNPYCERLIGSIRRECLDHVVVLTERYLLRVLPEFQYLHSFGHLSIDQTFMNVGP